VLHVSLHTFFHEVPLFAGLDADELTELSREVAPRDWGAGERLFAQGDVSDGMYVIERGEVGVFACPGQGSRVMLAELGPGAVIGELSLVDGSPRSALVETVSMTSGYFLSRDAFDRLRFGGSLGATKIVLALGRTLEQRKRVTEERLRNLVGSNVEAAELHSRELRELFGRLLKS
jgi:CRP-like cAMP-binding protein